MALLETNHRFIAITIGVFFILLITAVLISIYNPQEKAKKTSDLSMLAKSKIALNSINKYFEIIGALPWAQVTGSKNATPSLPWTIANDDLIGFCRDVSCAIPGKVEDVVATIEGKVSFTSQDLIYIGKGVNPKDPIYACFVPQSQEIRKNTGNLSRIDITSRTSAPSSLIACSDRVTWKDQDLCYLCIKN